MKSIYIKTGKLQDVFNELKDSFKGTLTSNDNGYSIALKTKIAEGSIEGKIVDEEIAYFEFDTIFHDDIRLSMEIDNDLPVFFSYCLDGSIQHSFGEQAIKKSIKKHQMGILTSKSSINSILYFPKNTPIKLSIIRLSLNNVATTNNNELIKKVKNIFFKTKEDYLDIKPQSFKIMKKIKELNNLKQVSLSQKLLEKIILKNILEIEISQHTDSLLKIVQEINSLSLKSISQIKKASNRFVNYSIEELFTIKGLITKSDFFINKLDGGFKTINSTKANYLNPFIRTQRQSI
ncbi:MAG: hypothetical protein ABI554_07115 [Flavobacterium sp.]